MIRKVCIMGGFPLAVLSVSLFATLFSLFSHPHSINNASTAKLSGCRLKPTPAR
jgi:hypothetical protein